MTPAWPREPHPSSHHPRCHQGAYSLAFSFCLAFSLAIPACMTKSLPTYHAALRTRFPPFTLSQLLSPSTPLRYHNRIPTRSYQPTPYDAVVRRLPMRCDSPTRLTINDYADLGPLATIHTIPTPPPPLHFAFCSLLCFCLILFAAILVVSSPMQLRMRIVTADMFFVGSS